MNTRRLKPPTLDTPGLYDFAPELRPRFVDKCPVSVYTMASVAYQGENGKKDNFLDKVRDASERRIQPSFDAIDDIASSSNLVAFT